ncbi:porin family protein [Rufibacter sp. LB8]|uniref:porin family protein n=1 Tax=Rufibacter sp. LB8 TaxID=2777781 RepID=UPI00178C2EC9|nr:porin family protein [Rufibacter sp. LB8]
MKKVGLLGVLVLLSTVVGFAQTTLGVKGGINSAIIGGNAKNAKPRVGVHIGAFASTPISNRVALQPEVLYSQQGYLHKDDTYAFNYLLIPLIFKGTISGGLHAQVGPQFGMLLKATRTKDKTSTDITEDINRYDGGIALGLGYDVGAVQVSARYSLGLSDTRNAAIKGETFPNNVFQFSLGYRLR